MASLILGGSVLAYNKIKESRAKKREKKLWRESEYKALERETEERLSRGQAGAGKIGKEVGGSDGGEKQTVVRGRNNPFHRSEGDAGAGARQRSGSAGSARSRGSERGKGEGQGKEDWWEEKK